MAKLTLGVECSLYLLQAILKDQEFCEQIDSSLSENDIALMYSTAIIRYFFLFEKEISPFLQTKHYFDLKVHQPDFSLGTSGP